VSPIGVFSMLLPNDNVGCVWGWWGVPVSLHGCWKGVVDDIKVLDHIDECGSCVS
jgi:hypothetical protein